MPQLRVMVTLHVERIIEFNHVDHADEDQLVGDAVDECEVDLEFGDDSFRRHGYVIVDNDARVSWSDE